MARFFAIFAIILIICSFFSWALGGEGQRYITFQSFIDSFEGFSDNWTDFLSEFSAISAVIDQFDSVTKSFVSGFADAVADAIQANGGAPENFWETLKVYGIATFKSIDDIFLAQLRALLFIGKLLVAFFRVIGGLIVMLLKDIVEVLKLIIRLLGLDNSFSDKLAQNPFLE